MSNDRRKFLKKAGKTVAAAAGASDLGFPAVHAQVRKIRLRMQTYAGAALAEHVLQPTAHSFNKIAGDDLQYLLLCGRIC